jgi:hypothetical protein
MYTLNQRNKKENIDLNDRMRKLDQENSELKDYRDKAEVLQKETEVLQKETEKSKRKQKNSKKKQKRQKLQFVTLYLVPFLTAMRQNTPFLIMKYHLTKTSSVILRVKLIKKTTKINQIKKPIVTNMIKKTIVTN